MAFPADVSGFTLNKVKVNSGLEENAFNKGNISIGISTEYGSYGETCYSGWYQGARSDFGTSGSGYTIGKTIVYGKKKPGGSLFFRDSNNDGIKFNDPTQSLFINTKAFTIEFWFKHNTATTANTQYYLFGSFTDVDITDGIIFYYKHSTNIIFVKVYETTSLNPIINFSATCDASTWKHICLQRDNNNNIVFFVDGNVAQTSISNKSFPDAKTGTYSIGIPVDGSTIIYDRARCYFTNLRYMLNLAKYNNSGFTVPLYPIPALNSNNIKSHLMLNVRQDTQYLNNSGISSYTFSAQTSFPIWSTQTPFLSDIPSIFYSNTDDDFVNNVRLATGVLSADTYARAMNTFRNNSDIMLQNFVYPDIPMTYLTHLYDSGHLSSYPYDKLSIQVGVSDMWYNLVDNSKNVATLYSGVTFTSNTNNFLFKTSTTTDNVTISGLYISSSFTILIVARPKSNDNFPIFYFDNPISDNSLIDISINGTRIYYRLMDNSIPTLILNENLNYVDNAPNTIVLGFDAASGIATWCVNNDCSSIITGAARDGITRDVKMFRKNEFDVYAIFLYNGKLLSDSEITTIRNALRIRIPDLV